MYRGLRLEVKGRDFLSHLPDILFIESCLGE